MKTADIKKMLNQKVVIRFNNGNFPQLGIVTDCHNKNVQLDDMDWYHFSQIESISLKEYDVLNSAEKEIKKI